MIEPLAPLRMTTILVCIGRFYYFHLARELHRQGMLDRLFTGYPWFKVKNEEQIPRDKIKTFPWFQVPYMARGFIGLQDFRFIDKLMSWVAKETLDIYVRESFDEPVNLISMSGTGYRCGMKAKLLGARYYCDRGSMHIRHQYDILEEEYQRYGFKAKLLDKRILAKEEKEYALCDYITVPSQICASSYVSHGISPKKIRVIPYGSSRSIFFPSIATRNRSHMGDFKVLFVGQGSPRKGFIDLLMSYEKLSHPAKKLTVIGSLSKEAKHILDRYDLSTVTFLGNVEYKKLAYYYNDASVLVQPSIEDGFAMVIGDALACGLPVITTNQTGASELIKNNVNGFVVPIRRPDLISNHLQNLADDESLLLSMRKACVEISNQRILTWESYGREWINLLRKP